MADVRRKFTLLSNTLTAYWAVSVMAIPAYATCDISGYWSLEAEDFPLSRSPFVKFGPLDDGRYKRISCMLPSFRVELVRTNNGG